MNEFEKAMRMALEFCEFCWRDVALNSYALEKLEQTTAALNQALAKDELQLLRQYLREAVDFQSTGKSPTIHDYGRWRRLLDQVCAPQAIATTGPEWETSPMDGEQWETTPMSATTERKLVATPDHNGALVPASPADMQVYNKIAAGYWTERKRPLSKDQIREVFLAHGFTVKEGQTDLKPYVYDAAYALIALVQQPTERKGEPGLFATEVQPQPLRYSLDDYHRAPSEGPLNATWQDKPHRLLYDLIAALAYYTSPQVPEYAWQTIADYEKDAGFQVDFAFKAGWRMARTMNSMFKEMADVKRKGK